MTGSGDDGRVIPLDPFSHEPDMRTPARQLSRQGVDPRRTVAWFLLALVGAVSFLLAQRSPQPSLSWEQVETPNAALNIDSLVATASGFALASGPEPKGGSLWTSSDGRDWQRLALPTAPTRVVPDGEGMFLAYGARSLFTIDVTTSDGDIQVLDMPDLIRTGYGSRRAGVIPGTRDLIAHTMNGDLFRARRGRTFGLAVRASRWRTGVDVPVDSACRPPSRSGPDIPPVLDSGDVFIAYVAADDPSAVWPVCEPIPWTSGDGGLWKKEASESPFGPGAFVADVERFENQYVAVGGIGQNVPAVWRSSDGVEWSAVTPPEIEDAFELVEVDGGAIGWVAMGQLSDRAGYRGWYSSDGSCWEPLPDEVEGRSVAVGADAVLIGDRTDGDAFWLGTPNRPQTANRCPELPQGGRD